jgi:hypothetical protein
VFTLPLGNPPAGPDEAEAEALPQLGAGGAL